MSGQNLVYFLFFASITFILVFAPDSAFACTCNGNPNPPCRAYGKADAIFDAVVTGRQKITDPDLSYLNRRRYKVEIRRVFKGAASKPLYVYTGIGDSDCGYRFQIGKRYLIYAYEAAGKLTTSICTRTGRLKEASEDLDYIAKWPLLPRGVSVFGRVERRWFDGTKSLHEPLRSFEITINGPEKTTIRTNADGTYSIAGLPTGPYSVRAEPPVGYRLSALTSIDLFPTAVFEESIPDRACLQADFVFEQ